MTASEEKSLQVKEKQELNSPTEQTRPGLVFTPSVDIFENEREIFLVADMPGVKAENLNIDLRDDTLTILGEPEPHDELGGEAVLMEYEEGKYYRQFSLSEVIDQKRIDAQLKNGVLRLILPKVEKATPRRITVRSD